MTPPLWQNTKKKKKTKKKPLDESERGECKSWLETLHLKNEDHGIWSHHFMANRWGNNGNSYKFYLFCLKITADGGCSHAIKRHLLLGRKAMNNLDGILKSRDITFQTNVHLVKTMAFPVVMYGCEYWAIKKAECWRIDALELWSCRKLLRIPWTARRSSHPILMEISPECSLESLML